MGLLKIGKSIIKNRGEIKKIIQTIKNPPQGGMVDKLISALNKEFGIPMERIRKMINKKDGGMVKKFEEGGDVKKNGKSRFILPNADYDLNDPNFMRFIKRKMKKEGITQQEAIDSFKSDVVKHNKAKGNPGFINYRKGGVVFDPSNMSPSEYRKKLLASGSGFIPMQQMQAMFDNANKKKLAVPMKKMKKGGSVKKSSYKKARGTGAAIRGTKFKGVF